MVERVVAQETCIDSEFVLPTPDEHVTKMNMMRRSGRALRVGYISYDWRRHPMGR